MVSVPTCLWAVRAESEGEGMGCRRESRWGGGEQQRVRNVVGIPTV